MVVEVDGYRFTFPDAIDAYKFDETDHLSPHFHGASMMKAVDVMVEFPKCYLFVEIKDFTKDIKEILADGVLDWKSDKARYVTWLKNNLIRKCRDTFIYRYCEKKVDKKILFVCLLNFDSALKNQIKRIVSSELPERNPNPQRWVRHFVDGVFFVDEAAWNRNLAGQFGSCQYLG